MDFGEREKERYWIEREIFGWGEKLLVVVLGEIRCFFLVFVGVRGFKFMGF